MRRAPHVAALLLAMSQRCESDPESVYPPVQSDSVKAVSIGVPEVDRALRRAMLMCAAGALSFSIEQETARSTSALVNHCTSSVSRRPRRLQSIDNCIWPP